MSRTMKWVVGIVIVAALAALAWWYMSPSAQQGASETAAVVNSGSAGSPDANVVVARSITALDAQIKTSGANITALMNKPTQANVTAASVQMQAIVTALSQISAKLETRIASSQATGTSATALRNAYADLTRNITNASSQASVAARNMNATSTPNATALAQAQTQLIMAQTYVNNARQDIKTITQILMPSSAASTRTR